MKLLLEQIYSSLSHLYSLKETFDFKNVKTIKPKNIIVDAEEITYEFDTNEFIMDVKFEFITDEHLQFLSLPYDLNKELFNSWLQQEQVVNVGFSINNNEEKGTKTNVSTFLSILKTVLVTTQEFKQKYDTKAIIITTSTKDKYSMFKNNVYGDIIHKYKGDWEIGSITFKHAELNKGFLLYSKQ